MASPKTSGTTGDLVSTTKNSSKTKAVMFAHALGNPFDLITVCEFCHKHDLYLIEDNCDALGCTYRGALFQGSRSAFVPKSDRFSLGGCTVDPWVTYGPDTRTDLV